MRNKIRTAEHNSAYYKANKEKMAAYNKEWNKKNKEARAKHSWVYLLKKNYSLTVDQFNAMLATQDGVCAICRGPQEGSKNFCVDHDHATGRIRGLLCCSCNKGLGHFFDDLENIRRAYIYIGGLP